MTYSTELAGCSGLDPLVVSTRSCTVAISTLQASPFNLAWGASIYAKVQATNLVNSSDISNFGNGAVILTNPSQPTNLVN